METSFLISSSRKARLFFTPVFMLSALAAQADDGSIILRAPRMLDVHTGAVREDVIVVVRENRIESIQPGSGFRAPEKATLITLPPASMLLPGLIDVHTHLTWSSDAPSRVETPGISIPREPLVGAAMARRTIEAGFTTVRSLGSRAYSDVALRDAVADGYVVGPRMLVAVTGLGGPGGVCESVFGSEGAVRGAEPAAQKVRKLVDAGADVIKVCSGGGVLPDEADEIAKEPELTDEELRAIVQASRRLGKKVAAHAQGVRAIARAVLAGVDSIEHGGLLDEPTALLMKQKGVYLVPTLYRLDWLLEQASARGAPPERVNRLRKTRDRAFAAAATAIRANVPIAFGTDATVIPHGRNAAEFAVLVRLGMSNLDAIRTATLNAASLLALEHEVGSIAVGKSADLLVVDGDPTTDIAALERALFVMKSGKVVKPLK